MLFLSLTEILVRGNQFSDTLLDLFPAQKDFCIRVHDAASTDFDALSVMVLIKLPAGNSGIRTADAVLILQKRDICFMGFLLQVLLIDTVLSLMDAAATSQNSVNIFLRNNKSGGCFSLRFCNQFLLFFLRGKTYA